MCMAPRIVASRVLSMNGATLYTKEAAFFIRHASHATPVEIDDFDRFSHKLADIDTVSNSSSESPWAALDPRPQREETDTGDDLELQEVMQAHGASDVAAALANGGDQLALLNLEVPSPSPPSHRPSLRTWQ